MRNITTRIIAVFVCSVVAASAALWDANVYVTIGNAGNSDDIDTGYGGVDYEYGIAKKEVSVPEWEAFYNDPGNAKLGGFSTAYNAQSAVGTDAPVVNVRYREAAQYCNWLTTGSATSGAYTIDGSGTVTATDRDYRNGDGLVYVLPTEDEWYKAAYYNGSSYSAYANGTAVAPALSTDGVTGWNYSTALPSGVAWTVDKGTAEQNGTFNMMGNAYEWIDDGSGVRRGGFWDGTAANMVKTYRGTISPTSWSGITGFRVVAIPEPATISMMGVALLTLGFRRRLGR